MSSCTSRSDSVGGDTSEYEWCPLRFGLLRDTSHWGKIGSTGPLALVYSFSSAHHAKDPPFFQASPPISLVSVALPKLRAEGKMMSKKQFLSHNFRILTITS